MHSGLVSTIIPVYNRPSLLVDAVESVVQQSYDNIEVIIVDDGSDDSTPQVANALSSENQAVSYIRIANSGPGLARNAGLKRARGEFIQYLDSDDLLHRDKFELQVSGLQANPNSSVSYCVQQYCDIHGAVLNPVWMRSGERHSTMFPAMLEGRLWGTPTPLYRRSIVDKAGPWLDLKSEEDWEYDCRIASFGVELHYCPETLVSVRHHDGDHLGQLTSGQEFKLSDKCAAYQAIYQHALKANIRRESAEFAHFNRMIFFLSRSCGKYGLITEAKQLLELAKRSAHGNKVKVEYNTYSLLVALIGHSAMGKISAKLDKLRS